MAIRIDSLEVQIKTSASSAAPAIEKLTKSLTALRNATKAGLGLGRMANQLKTFTETLQKTNFATIASNADALGKELGKISARIAGINGKKLSDLNGVIKVLATSANNLSAKALLKKALEEVDEDARKATEQVKNLNKETKELGTFGKLGKAFVKAGGGLLSSIGRIAFYRAIRSALKAVTTALKEGAGNLYQYGKSSNSNFVQALDNAATSIQYLKNGIAVGLAPIIQALTPLVVTCADAIAEFGNAVSEAFANANGEKYFTRAVKSFKEYQEAVEAAKSTTLGFDELNVIDNKNPISGMFEEVAVDSERAEASMLKFSELVAGIVGVGAGGLSLKALLGLKDAELIDLDIGSIMLKAAGIGLTVSGGFDLISAIADAINNGGFSEEGDIQSAIGIVKAGAGLSLVISNPIPIAIALVAQFGFTGKYVGNFVGDLKKSINEPIEEWINGIDSWFDGLKMPPLLDALFKGNILRTDAHIFGQIGEGLSNALEGTLGAWYDLFHGDWSGWLENGKKAMKGIAEAFLAPIVGVINSAIDRINALTGSNIARIDWTPSSDDIKSGVASTGAIAGAIAGITIAQQGATSNGVPGELQGFGSPMQMGVGSGGIKIQLYVDGKQIIGAARMAEPTMGKQLVSNGIVYE